MFAGLTALLAVGAVVGGQPFALVAAAPLALTSYFMYYHGSGKLARAVRSRRGGRRRERARGGFGAGPRSRGDPRTRAEREARFGAGANGRRERTGPRESGPTVAEARDVLGVDRRADDAEIRRAYRNRVKEVHPDRGGDEEDFKRVTAAYERLRE